MNERIKELAEQAGLEMCKCGCDMPTRQTAKFAELIVKEMCRLMEQAEDDAYHCFEPAERPTEYIDWLRDWQDRFVKQVGVKNERTN